MLIATTVIEVGIDGANATLMVVEHAERFGLPQLHQLRGRMGRGAEQSYCILIADEGAERLHVLAESDHRRGQYEAQSDGPLNTHSSLIIA